MFAVSIPSSERCCASCTRPIPQVCLLNLVLLPVLPRKQLGLTLAFGRRRRAVVSPRKMSDQELQEALAEYKDSRLLLPGRLIPGYGGKLSIEDFCRRYKLPGDIASLLIRMKIRDAHGLSKLYLRELRDSGLVLRSINMLQLAVIRFSSESRP